MSSCAYTTQSQQSQSQSSPIPRSSSDLALASNKHAVVLALVCHSAASGKGSPVADLGVGPEGHRPQLKSDWPLKCPCPVTHRGFTLALSRLKFNLCSASFTCKYEGTCV